MIGQGHDKSFYGERSIDHRLLGDEYFVLDILEETEAFLPKKPGLAVIEAIELVIGRDACHLLTAAGREARSFEVRALAAWAIIEYSSATLTELGRYCNRDQSTMSCAARRIEKLRALRPDIEEKMEQLGALLIAPKFSGQ
jgi:putative transposase